MSTFTIDFRESKCKINIFKMMVIRFSAVCISKTNMPSKREMPQAYKFTEVNIVCPEFAVKLVAILTAVFIQDIFPSVVWQIFSDMKIQAC